MHMPSSTRSTHAMRVGSAGLFTALAGVAVRLISEWINFPFLEYLSAFLVVLGVAVVFWAGFFMKD